MDACGGFTPDVENIRHPPDPRGQEWAWPMGSADNTSDGAGDADSSVELSLETSARSRQEVSDDKALG